jgi:hypothetical protein
VAECSERAAWARGGLSERTKSVEHEFHRRFEDRSENFIVALEPSLAVKGDQSVHMRPQGHSGKEGVDVSSKCSRVHAFAQSIDEKDEIRRPLVHRKPSLIHRDSRKEQEFIVEGAFESERKKALEQLVEAPGRIRALEGAMQVLAEGLVRLVDKGRQQVSLVVEVTVDRGGGDPDTVGQGAHAERLHTAIAAELAGGGEDLIVTSDRSSGSG